MSPIIIGVVTLVLVITVLGLFIKQTSSNSQHPIVTPVKSHTLTPSAARLVCNTANRQQSYAIQKSTIQIGRSSDCDIHIEGDLVSRIHAIIRYTGSQYILQDQDSTNGTWVNGQRVIQHAIQPGDQIQIGPSICNLYLSGQVAQRPNRPVDAPIVPPNVSIPGEYSYLQTLPAGGAATVFKVRSVQNGTIAALKMLHSRDPYIYSKFIDEINVSRALNHPHIVNVYGGGSHNGIPYMIMEFLEYGSLRDRMQVGCPLDINTSIKIIGQMCEALSYVQPQGIYHRDIKPENILFASQSFCKLADFGIAKVAQSATRTRAGMVIGTPAYMSIEQIKGTRLNHQSDIYSLGIVLYELLVGHPPFVSSDPMEIMDMHIRERPMQPTRYNSRIPKHIEKVILKALRKAPRDRFQDASEMARALGYSYNH